MNVLRRQRHTFLVCCALIVAGPQHQLFESPCHLLEWDQWLNHRACHCEPQNPAIKSSHYIFIANLARRSGLFFLYEFDHINYTVRNKCLLPSLFPTLVLRLCFVPSVPILMVIMVRKQQGESYPLSERIKEVRNGGYLLVGFDSNQISPK